MWNQGKSAFNMNVDTDDARRRAERVMEAAARSGAALPLHSTWVRKIDDSDPKSRWIVEGSKPDAAANLLAPKVTVAKLRSALEVRGFSNWGDHKTKLTNFFKFELKELADN